MTTAVEWERENAADLKAMAEALAENDRYLAEEILNKIAPYPEGENVQTSKPTNDAYFHRLAKFIDPETGRVDNPNGPAIVEGDGTRKWYRADMLHNSHGPAKIKPNGKLSYYYMGKRCKSAEDLDEVVAIAKRHNEKSKHVRNPKA